MPSKRLKQGPLPQAAVRGLLEPQLGEYVEAREYEIAWVAAPRLLTHNRLDLAIKGLFLKMRPYRDVSFATDIYANHIRAFTLGSFVEPGNSQKDSLEAYLSEFERTFESIRTSGFDPTKSLVPLSRGGSISNGAHRVASAVVLGVDVPTVQLDMPDDQYGYRFFLERGLSRAEVEVAVTYFVELADNCYTAIIWPSARGKQDDILEIIPNIVYQGHFSLNMRGAHNLVSQVYSGEAWLGPQDQNFPGASNKVVECFRNSDDVRLVVFQADTLRDAQRIKDDVRALFQIGKHSIHINDTKEEAVRICRMLLNSHSVHFLNNGDPTKFKSTGEKIKRLKEFLAAASVAVEDLVLDTGMVLALYGIRESSDVDYLSPHKIEGAGEPMMAPHDEELAHHGIGKNEIIFNSSYHFSYDGLKFVSLQQVLEMKKRRSNEKDRNDLAILSAKLSGRKGSLRRSMARQEWYYLKTRAYLGVLAMLRALGMYRLVRWVYRRLSGKVPGS